MKVTDDIVSSEHRFKSNLCNPKYNIRVSLEKFKGEEGEADMYGMCVWGTWGDTNPQFNLDFKDKQEAVNMLKGMIAVIKTDFKGDTE